MTAPDPGLTDLLAAHTLRVVELNEAVRYPECNGCDWVGGLVKDHAKHLALVVEQHTQGQTAHWQSVAEVSRSRELNALARAEQAEANALAWSETYRGAVKVRDEWRSRAEKAEATVARVQALADSSSGRIIGRDGAAGVTVFDLRAALEGEQR